MIQLLSTQEKDHALAPPAPAATIEAAITPSYRKIYVLFFGREAIESGTLAPGRVTVYLRDDEEFAAEGTLNGMGSLSGMVGVYRRFNLQAGDKVTFEVVAPTRLAVVSVTRAAGQGGLPEAAENIPAPAADAPGVFARHRLRYRHIEVFSPTNLLDWQPETETDVYLAFGVLQKYTEYRYCCGASKSLLDDLGLELATKPDAILIKEDTRDYILAEFKMRSSAFPLNHKPDDVDLLVVWDDDQVDRALLPGAVLSLREVARSAAQEAIAD
jgi:hypothetical protein